MTTPILTMLISPIMAMSNKSWIMMWIMMEISSMAMVTFMNNSNKKSNDSEMKYFLIQSIASMTMLMGLMTSHQKTMMLSVNSTWISTMVMMSLATKMAMVPTHKWLLKMSNLLKIKSMFMMLTIQKVIPMMIMMNNNVNHTMKIICLLSIILGTLSQMNTSTMKTIMVLSSITHTGWMMSSINLNKWTSIMYLTVYSIMLGMFFMLAMNSNMKTIQTAENKKIGMVILIMSMSGIPPMMGFIIKWMVLKLMVQNSLMMASAMIIMACINFFIYMRMINFNLWFSMEKTNMKKWTKNNTKLITMNVMMPLISMKMLK